MAMSKFNVWVIGFFSTEVYANTPEQARKLAQTKMDRELYRKSDDFVFCRPDYDMDPEKID